MSWKKHALAGLGAVMFGATLVLSGGTGSAGCGAGQIEAATLAASGQSIAGYSGDQLANAAAIMNAATSLGLNVQAQTIGVMTAMGESGLRVVDHGDAAGPDSRGLFQQRDSWGSYADRMDPTKSALLFFKRLQTVQGWETMTPTAAAHAVQINADPDHYTKWFAPAGEVVKALSATGGAGSCGVGGDKVALAQQLVDAADAGTLRGFTPDHIKEIRWIAQGKEVADCGIDVPILQIMVLALNEFERIGVSDINRKCTGQIEGAGLTSSHYINGGGGAVDFYSLGGTSITGADGPSIRLISLLDPIVPKGARIGQEDCRADAGTTIATQNFSQIYDSCNHLHVDVAYTNGKPLLLGGQAG